MGMDLVWKLICAVGVGVGIFVSASAWLGQWTSLSTFNLCMGIICAGLWGYNLYKAFD